jgi:hypothetical protein
MTDKNDWEVAYSTILFFERLLEGHKKVASFRREEDILFKITRTEGLSSVAALLVDEYSLGVAAVLRACREFPELECIVTCANWNGYTPDAKAYGEKNGIGIFVVGEFVGALWWKNPIEYVQKDERGSPIYHFKVA